MTNKKNLKEEKLLISARDSVIKTAYGKYEFNGKDIEDASKLDEKKLINEIDQKISEILNDFAGGQHENTIILAGAGASMLKKENKSDSVDGKYYSGKSVKELTEKINSFLDNDDKNVLTLEELARKVNYIKKEDKYNVNLIDIEDLLSKAESAKEFLGTDDKFNTTLKKTEMKIKELCSLTLHKEHPHKRFLQKITSRRNSHSRVKIFTTNYDTLFEQAARKSRFLIIDGFTYEYPRTFDPYMYNYDFVRREENKIMDEPDYVEKVFHLYKLHGSVDWEDKDNEITKNLEVEEPLMIYPRKDKFEQSYEPPYFEMFSRFQNELRKKNTLLITVGFSFADKHIHMIVENAIKNNPGIKMLIVDYNLNQEGFKEFKEHIKEGYNNIMFFQEDFQEFTKLYLKQKAYSDRFFEGSKEGEDTND